MTVAQPVHPVDGTFPYVRLRLAQQAGLRPVSDRGGREPVRLGGGRAGAAKVGRAEPLTLAAHERRNFERLVFYVLGSRLACPLLEPCEGGGNCVAVRGGLEGTEGPLEPGRVEHEWAVPLVEHFGGLSGAGIDVHLHRFERAEQ